jgi:hypothetical protein
LSITAIDAYLIGHDRLPSFCDPLNTVAQSTAGEAACGVITRLLSLSAVMNDIDREMKVVALRAL